MKKLLLIPLLAAPMWLYSCTSGSKVQDVTVKIEQAHEAIREINPSPHEAPYIVTPTTPGLEPTWPNITPPAKKGHKHAKAYRPAPAPLPPVEDREEDVPVPVVSCLLSFIAPCIPGVP